jgi:TFIIF-interacting CTD phosphatase-like protein
LRHPVSYQAVAYAFGLYSCREGRLCLVLDLDHTLVNSSKFSECDEAAVGMMSRVMAAEASMPANQRSLYKLDQIQMYTKLRPGVREFLRKAAPHWELWIHTNGTRYFDPSNCLHLDMHLNLHPSKTPHFLKRTESLFPYFKAPTFVVYP